jgi:Ca2+-transporting ATPase
MSVMVRRPEGGFVLYCKGAPDFMLKDLHTELLDDGTVRPLDDARRAQIADAVDAMAGRGLRTLCLGLRLLPAELEGENPAAPDSVLTFVAMVGIKDPVRQQVPDAVRRCKEAGITVRMVTGDNEKTARFIAIECRILDESAGHTVMIVRPPSLAPSVLTAPRRVRNSARCRGGSWTRRSRRCGCWRGRRPTTSICS